MLIAYVVPALLLIIGCNQRSLPYQAPNTSVHASPDETGFDDWVRGVQVSDLPTGDQRVVVSPSKKGIFTEYQLCNDGACRFGVSSQNFVDIPRSGLMLSGASLPEMIRLRACSLKSLKKSCSPWKEKSLITEAFGSFDKRPDIEVPRTLEHLIYRHRELKDEIRAYGIEIVKSIRAYDADFKKNCPKKAVRFVSELQAEHFISIGTHGLGEGLVEFTEARVLAESGWSNMFSSATAEKDSVSKQKRTSFLFGAMSISSGIAAAASAKSTITGILPTVNTLAGGALILYAARDANQKFKESEIVSCGANNKIRVILDAVHTDLNKTNEELQVVVLQMAAYVNSLNMAEIEALSRLYPEVPSTVR